MFQFEKDGGLVISLEIIQGLDQKHLGFSDGKGELYLDQGKVAKAFDEKPIELSIEPLLKMNVSVEEIKQIFELWEYKHVETKKEQLFPGEYFIDEVRRVMTVVFLPGIHPHSFMGVTKNEKIITGTVSGGETHFKGVTLKALARDLIADGAKDIFLWGNGKDSFIKYQDKKEEGDGIVKAYKARGDGLEAIVITKRSEMRQLEESQSDVNRILTPSKVEITRVARYIFDPEILSRGRDVFNRLLESLVPTLYAKDRIKDYSPIFSDDMAMVGNTASLIFDNVPDTNSDIVQAVIQFMARNKFIPFQIVVPGANIKELLDLKRNMEKEVLVISRKGIKLDIANGELFVSQFIEEKTKERALVFDSRKDGFEFLSRIGTSLKEVGVFRVYNDTSVTEEAYALLAAIEDLGKLKRIPKGVKRAFDILSERLESWKQIRQIIEQAA